MTTRAQAEDPPRPRFIRFLQVLVLGLLCLLPAASILNVDLIATVSARGIIRERLPREMCGGHHCWFIEQFDRASVQSIDEIGYAWQLDLVPRGSYTQVQVQPSRFVRVARSRWFYADVDGLLGGRPPHHVRLCLTSQTEGSSCANAAMRHLDHDTETGIIAVVLERTNTDLEMFLASHDAQRRMSTDATFVLAEGQLAFEASSSRP